MRGVRPRQQLTGKQDYTQNSAFGVLPAVPRLLCLGMGHTELHSQATSDDSTDSKKTMESK